MGSLPQTITLIQSYNMHYHKPCHQWYIRTGHQVDIARIPHDLGMESTIIAKAQYDLNANTRY